MKILKIIVDQIPEKEFCDFSYPIEDDFLYCSVTDEICNELKCPLQTGNKQC